MLLSVWPSLLLLGREEEEREGAAAGALWRPFLGVRLHFRNTKW
jgi:hypothetical protein